MKIGVIVVSYNTSALLRTCLMSIVSSFEHGAQAHDQLSVIVVDSASTDGSPEMVAAEFPQFTLLAQKENIGFVRGNNLALSHLGFTLDPHIDDTALSTSSPPVDVVLLLNPDAELVADALWKMARFLIASPAAGVCGAHLQYGDGSFQHGAFAFPTFAQVLIDFFPLVGFPGAHRLQNSRLNGRYPQASWRSTQPFPVDFVLGAAFMIKGSLIQQIGGLDPLYIMYCEEMDWCVRAAEAGYQSFTIPMAEVIHHEAQSSRQVRWPSYVRMWESRFRFYQKHCSLYPRGYVILLRLILKPCLAWRKRQAGRQFRQGESTGVEWFEAVSAYAAVGRL